MDKIVNALREGGFNYFSKDGESLSVSIGYGLIVRIAERENQILLSPKFQSWNLVTGLLRLSLHQARLYIGLSAIIGAILVFYLVETVGLHSFYLVYGAGVAVSTVALWRAESSYEKLKSVIFN